MSKESFDPRTAKLKQVKFSELEVGDIFFYGGWMVQKTEVYSIGGMYYNHQMLISNKLGYMANTSKVWVEDIPPVVKLKDLVPGEFFVLHKHSDCRPHMCISLDTDRKNDPTMSARVYDPDSSSPGMTCWYSRAVEVSRVPNPFLSKAKLTDEDE